MNKIILAAFLLFAAPTLLSAQKHAPRPSNLKKYTPGIYPEGSKRLLGYADIEGLTSWDLKVMRNEIYARHGYIFKTEEMSSYFNQQRWYSPRYNDVNSLITPIEKKNIAFIQSYE